MVTHVSSRKEAGTASPLPTKINGPGSSTQPRRTAGEKRVPELLQWKDREMADDLAKFMVGSKTKEHDKEGSSGDVVMEGG
jgi:hypothetical protein